ncbi:hypothetical protein L596_025178 [Steinernema carpocapsae]|uniref:Uncharacterized protein n=1 Tax=Steinernema carpocapsae TaxID=34508 RepID=A0A4U5M720_STECR|nr:hypothetical protein L596_025178 [Steinernema carpocapsae]
MRFCTAFVVANSHPQNSKNRRIDAKQIRYTTNKFRKLIKRLLNTICNASGLRFKNSKTLFVLFSEAKRRFEV